MNTDVSLIRAYIVPAMTPANGKSVSSSSGIHGNYQKLLPRRQELCRSAKKSPSTITNIDQTLTVLEQFKFNPTRSVTNFNYTANPMIKNEINDTKTLTPRELCTQLNNKLDYLIRTRAIERSRVLSRTTILPSTSIRSRSLRENPRQSSSPPSSSSMSKPLPPKSIVMTSTNTTTAVAEEIVDKYSLDDNDEIVEEMIEEENINFLQQAP